MQAVATVDVLAIEHVTEAVRCVAIVCTNTNTRCRVHVGVFLQVLEADGLSLIVL